jgi:hypothetical protein
MFEGEGRERERGGGGGVGLLTLTTDNDSSWRARGVDKAVAVANGTEFGLASAVMSSTPGRCRNVANKIRAGAVYCSSTGEGLLFEFPDVQRGGCVCIAHTQCASVLWV